MARIEIGRGLSVDTLNVYGIKNCQLSCPFKIGNGRFKCVKYNGDAVIIVDGGIKRDKTIEEFKSVAPCFKK